MKLTIERGALLQALGHVQSVVERRNTIPILSNILLQAEGESVRLVATDLDIEAQDHADARISQNGAVTAPASTLFDVVRKLPAGADVELELNAENQQLTIRSGRSKFSLPTLSANDFQTMQADEGAAEFHLEAAGLRRLIDKTRFAISTEETRYYLNGVYLHVAETAEGQTLRSVATDGHRLALSEMPAPGGAEDLKGVIVPRKAIAEVRRLIENEDGDVSISVSDTKIVFQAGRAQLTSKLIDGTFPDYARVIPKANDKALIIDNKTFEAAVDRVATVSAERSRSVKLSISEGKVVLTVNSAETGQGREEIECDYQADPMDIGFNAKYLLDVAAQIEAEDARFLFNDPASPTLILDPGDSKAQYVLMPLRV